MSASLVGSEMCIRDRRFASCSKCSASKTLKRTTRAQVHFVVASTAPVSYTHLTLPTICSV
eukprot:8832975-Alexandrium_andersonii.AAC.1